MVTISDIARELGVTPSTVSRALSGSPRVSNSTREAVLGKAAELGYEPNLMASSLRRGHSAIVGIIVPRIHREFFSNVIGGAESVLNAAGYSVLICQSHERSEDELDAIHTLRKNQVAGILMSHAIETSDPASIAEAIGSIPLVQFDRVFRTLPGAKVINDNFEGAYAATRHLISNGYKRIGTLAGALSCEAFRDRLAGYRKALEDSGIAFDESLVFPDCIVREAGYEAGFKALEKGCDALYSAGDFSALGAIEALKSKGVSFPDDFGIVGTADETFTRVMSPSLSSLGQQAYEMGRTAAKAFLFRTGAISVISMILNIRESSNRNNICQK